MSKATKNKLTATVKNCFENSIYIGNLCAQTKIMIEQNERTSSSSSPPSCYTPIKVMLIAEKLLRPRLWNFKPSVCFCELFCEKVTSIVRVDYFVLEICKYVGGG